ncbi:Aste57867_21363 [Aphanomyces stellatus]|uniref:Aste57867_21363 protein n=1 Tax=Aphanomyces stellatus TaxID=120398 RepID=A0A485LJE3_9STRA|nr:hypothetical protein As57867_021294 [Aphanomyces stellatus]VFT98035.1 Aste57867_21363 [Aphanomyces stellatus]
MAPCKLKEQLHDPLKCDCATPVSPRVPLKFVCPFSNFTQRMRGASGKIQDLHTRYNAALALAERPGTHCVVGALPSFVQPFLQLQGVEEPLSWPLSNVHAADLLRRVKRSVPAAAVQGDACCIPASALTFRNPEWDAAVADLVRGVVATSLGIFVPIEAKLSHLVVDTTACRAPAVPPPPETSFATLVIAMPSFHEGGALVVRHEHATERFANSGWAASALLVPQFCAFYNPCAVQWTRLTRGRRVLLVYHLTLTDQPRALAPPSLHRAIAALRGVALTKRMPKRKFVSFLPSVSSHHPTWKSLTGIDLARANALQATGFFDVYLTTVTMMRHRPRRHRHRHRGGDCLWFSDSDDDEYGDEYDDEDEDDDDDERADVTTCTFGPRLRHPDGDAPQILSDISLPAKSDEFLTQPFRDDGQARFAALVFWPKPLRLVLLGLPRAVDWFAKLVKEPTSTWTPAARLGYPSADYMARRLLHMFDQTGDDYDNARSGVLMLEGLVALGNATLLGTFLTAHFHTYVARRSLEGLDLDATLERALVQHGVDALYLPLVQLFERACAVDAARVLPLGLPILVAWCNTRAVAVAPSPARRRMYYHHDDDVDVDANDDPTPPAADVVASRVPSLPYSVELIRGLLGTFVRHMTGPRHAPHSPMCRCHGVQRDPDVGLLGQALAVETYLAARLEDIADPPRLFLQHRLPSSLLALVDEFAHPRVVATILAAPARYAPLHVLAPVVAQLHYAPPTLVLAKPLVASILAKLFDAAPSSFALQPFHDVHDHYDDSEYDDYTLASALAVARLAGVFDAALAAVAARLFPAVGMVVVLAKAVRTYPHVGAGHEDAVVDIVLRTTRDVASMDAAALESLRQMWSREGYVDRHEATLQTRLVVECMAVGAALDGSNDSDSKWSETVARHFAAQIARGSKELVRRLFVPAANGMSKRRIPLAAWRLFVRACVDRLERDLQPVPDIQDWSLPDLVVPGAPTALTHAVHQFFRSPRLARVELTGRDVTYHGPLTAALHALALASPGAFAVRVLSSKTARVKGRLEIVKTATGRASVDDIVRVEALRAQRAVEDRVVAALKKLLAGDAPAALVLSRAQPTQQRSCACGQCYLRQGASAMMAW